MGARHIDGTLLILGPLSYKNKSKKCVVSDMVFFKHEYIPNPFVTPADVVIVAAGKMTEALCTHIHPSIISTTIQALKHLEGIFQEAADTDRFASIKLISGLLTEQILQQKGTPSRLPQKNTQANSRYSCTTSKGRGSTTSKGGGRPVRGR